MSKEQFTKKTETQPSVQKAIAARKKVKKNEKIKELLLELEGLFRDALNLKQTKRKKIPVFEKVETVETKKRTSVKLEKEDESILLFAYFLFLLKTDIELKRHLSSIERSGTNYLRIKTADATFNINDIIRLFEHYQLSLKSKEEKGKSFELTFVNTEPFIITHEKFLKLSEHDSPIVISKNNTLKVVIKGLHHDAHFDASQFTLESLNLEGKTLNRNTFIREIKAGILNLTTSSEAKVFALALLNLFDNEKFQPKRSVYDFIFEMPGLEITHSTDAFKFIESDPSVFLKEDNVQRFINDELTKDSMISILTPHNFNAIEKTLGGVLAALYVISSENNLKLKSGEDWNEDDFYYIRFPKTKGTLIDFQVLSKNKKITLVTEPLNEDEPLGPIKSVYSLKRIKTEGATLEVFDDHIAKLETTNELEDHAKRILQLLSVSYDAQEGYEERFLSAFQALQNYNDNFEAVLHHIKNELQKEQSSTLSLNDIEEYLNTIENSELTFKQKAEKLKSEIFHLLKVYPKDDQVIQNCLSAKEEKRTGLITSLMAQALVNLFNETNSSFLIILKELKSYLIKLREIHLNLNHKSGLATFVASTLDDDFSFIFDYDGSCGNVNRENIKIKALSGV